MNLAKLTLLSLIIALAVSVSGCSQSQARFDTTADQPVLAAKLRLVNLDESDLDLFTAAAPLLPEGWSDRTVVEIRNVDARPAEVFIVCLCDHEIVDQGYHIIPPCSFDDPYIELPDQPVELILVEVDFRDDYGTERSSFIVDAAAAKIGNRLTIEVGHCPYDSTVADHESAP